MSERKLRILIADDESLHVMRLRARLEEMGHEVVAEAGTGQEAVELAERTRPDLAILDIKMPDPSAGSGQAMDGIEAARAINAISPTPVVLLTAYSDDELVDRAVEAGVFAYLVKPVSVEELKPALALAMSRFREMMVLRQEVKDLQEALEARKVIERAKGILMRRLNLTEEEAFRRLQRRSQDESRKMVEIARAIIMADKML